MKLTKNEKKTLWMLLEKAKISDTEIGGRLKITKQAAGKIRKKLEGQNIIKNHKVNLNYEKLGITTFAMATFKHNSEDYKEIEQSFINSPHTISVYKISEGAQTYMVLYGFKDLMELESYFKPGSNLICHGSDFTKCMMAEKISIFSGQGILKNTPQTLLKRAIGKF
jgi:DNA-binding Lrp family transcriptional regulator